MFINGLFTLTFRCRISVSSLILNNINFPQSVVTKKSRLQESFIGSLLYFKYVRAPSIEIYTFTVQIILKHHEDINQLS
jgi:hypothetical protein